MDEDSHGLRLLPEALLRSAVLPLVWVTVTIATLCVTHTSGAAEILLGLAIGAVIFGALHHWELRRRTLPRDVPAAAPASADWELDEGLSNRMLVSIAVRAAGLAAGFWLLGELMDLTVGIVVVLGGALGAAISRVAGGLQARRWERAHSRRLLVRKTRGEREIFSVPAAN